MLLIDIYGFVWGMKVVGSNLYAHRKMHECFLFLLTPNSWFDWFLILKHHGELVVNIDAFRTATGASLKSMLELSCHIFLKLMGQSESLNLTSGIDRWFLDGMSIGLQTRYMMGTWLCSKGKRRYSCQSQRRVVLMSTRSIPRLHLHPHKLIASSWHLGIGWGDMAIANLSGLASLTNNHCLQQSYPNVRYRSDSVDGDSYCN